MPTGSSLRVPLGPHALTNALALSLKAALACLVALLVDRVTGNPDSVSSTFVAVLCTSPTLMIGLRLALAQLYGSMLGGLTGTLLLAAGLPALLGVPLAVGVSIGACFAVHFPQGYQAAAFSALFVQLVPQEGPAETYWVRVIAILTAATSGFLVNLLVSSRAYVPIFAQRLERVETSTRELIRQSVLDGPGCVRPGFGLVGALQEELARASEELRWRKNQATLERLEPLATRTDLLEHLLHLVYDLELLREQHGLPLGELRPFLEWCQDGEGPAPELPEALGHTGERVVTVRQALRESRPVGTDEAT